MESVVESCKFFIPHQLLLRLTGPRLCQVPLPITLLCGTEGRLGDVLALSTALLVFCLNVPWNFVGLV